MLYDCLVLFKYIYIIIYLKKILCDVQENMFDLRAPFLGNPGFPNEFFSSLHEGVIKLVIVFSVVFKQLA